MWPDKTDHEIEAFVSAPDEVLVIRMQSSGGFTSEAPIEFEARRAPAAPSPAASGR